MPKERPTIAAEEDIGRGGRDIAGLEAKDVQFAKLIEGRDYAIVEENKNITADRELQDFFLFFSPSAGNETRTVEPPHWRTVTTPDVRSVATVHINTGEGFVPQNAYFYCVNTKGVGYLKPSVRGKNFETYETWVKDNEPEHDFGHKILGLSSKDAYANDSIVTTQRLTEEGLRTEMYWAISKLKNVYYQGKLTSIGDLRKQGVILKRRDYQPYMAVRVLKTNSRIAEAAESDERRLQLFKDAFSTFNKEAEDRQLGSPRLQIGEKAHERLFFGEFFRRMGQNMAVLLNTGYSHYRLHSSNVTLAAEIVDVTTMNHWSMDEDPNFLKIYAGVRRPHIKDMRDMVYNLKILLKAGKLAGLSFGARDDLKKAFFEGFDNHLQTNRVREVQETNPDKAREWMEKIFDWVIIQKERLPAIQHREIEDWPIQVVD